MKPIEEVIKNKNILIEQKNRTTIQYLVNNEQE